MPAPRTCRSCGTSLTTRRCPRCGAEATEFAARPPLHEPGSSTAPSHLAVERGRTSRWEATETTFGPAVKVTLTIALLGLLVTTAPVLFFVLWFLHVFFTGWIIKELWRSGWIAPTTLDIGERESSPGIVPITEGLRVPPPPERTESSPHRPRTSGELAGQVLAVMACGAMIVALVFGSQEVRFATIAIVIVGGVYAFFRSVLD